MGGIGVRKIGSGVGFNLMGGIGVGEIETASMREFSVMEEIESTGIEVSPGLETAANNVSGFDAPAISLITISSGRMTTVSPFPFRHP